MRSTLVAAALLAPLFLAACAPSGLDRPIPPGNWDASHPALTVLPDTRTEFVAPGPRGRLQIDASRFRAVVLDHARHGHGAIEVTGSAMDVRAVSVALVTAGARPGDVLPRSVPGPRGALISFQAFRAVAPRCGAFASDVARVGLEDPTNDGTSELGCATQSNMAAMMAEPLDAVRRESPDISVNASAPVGAIDLSRTYVAPGKAAADGIGGSSQ